MSVELKGGTTIFSFEKSLENLQRIIDKLDFSDSDSIKLRIVFEEVQELQKKVKTLLS